MSDIHDLLRQTVEDFYVFGGLTDFTYAIMMNMIEFDHEKIKVIEQCVTPDIRNKWETAISDYHNGNMTEYDYLDVLSEIIETLEYNRTAQDPIKAYERAMSGI